MLARALEVPTPQRVEFVTSNCDDPQLRRELIELLGKEAELGTFLERPAAVLLAEDESEAPPAGPPLPETIGPYRILELLGEGGMGAVYLAEQDEPVERRLAVKVVRADLTAKGVRERFVAERQALARLSHPNIAQMYEAGTTEQGFPYFAMELVDGEPITTYCDRHQLSIEERLSLFVKVCEGVQHAHQRGIIHRDLKPSNILISEVDGRPVPKLIDFGIAKALDRPLTDVTQLTGLGAVGTPAYMSPESLGLDGHEIDVDTRTDVYALGVVLYELLAGVRPFDLTGASAAQIVQRMTSEEVPRPSVRVAGLEEGERAAIASDRGLEEHALSRCLAADLDWIVDKAIRRSREERYDSAAGFAADLGRYLEDQPVEASPPTFTYLAKKFVKRHKGGVAATAAGLLMLIAFAVTMTVQAERIAAERDRANAEAQAKSQVAEFLQGVFSISKPEEARGKTISARELLDRGAARIEKELADQPQLQAEMMHVIGTVYRSLGLFDRAEEMLSKAASMRERLLGPDAVETLASKSQLSVVYDDQCRYKGAEKLARQTHEGFKKVLGPEHEETLDCLGHLASILRDLGREGEAGRFGEAEQYFKQILDVRKRTLGDDHPKTLLTMRSYADIITHMGRIEEAAKLERQVYETQKRVLGEDHPETMFTLGNLAASQFQLGRYDDAAKLVRQVLDYERRVQGEDHPATLRTKLNLAFILTHFGRFKEAERLEDEAYEALEQSVGENHLETRRALSFMADNRSLQGRFEEAESLYRELLKRIERAEDGGPQETGWVQCLLAPVLIALGRSEEAESLVLETIKIGEHQGGEEHPLTLASRILLVEIWARTGKIEEARRCLEAGLEAKIRLKLPDEDKVEAYFSLAILETAQGNQPKALELLHRAVDLGYPVAKIQRDAFLKPLRATPEFQALIKKADRGS